MCTMIAEKLDIDGSAKGPSGWFSVTNVYLGYDHPVHADEEHALIIDFVNEGLGPSARVAVELDRHTARRLVARLQAALDAADQYEDG